MSRCHIEDAGKTREKVHVMWMRIALSTGVLGMLFQGNARAQVGFQFVDVTAARGIAPHQPEDGMGCGLAAADFNEDGYVDFFVPQAAGVPNLLYKNLGDGSFSESAALVGLDSTASSRVALWLDYDADGDLDLLVANDDQAAPSPFTLYRQNANGQFQDVTAQTRIDVAPTIVDPARHHWSGICAGDIDGDEHLDVFTSQWPGPGHLFRNDGQGAFDDISVSSGVAAEVWSYHQPIMADFNNDGLTDIFCAVDFDPNILWINQGDNTFVNAAADAGVDNAMNDMGVAVGDYDRDGDFDLYITNIYFPPGDPNFPGYNMLFRNNTVGSATSFVDVSSAMGVDNGGWGWGTTFVDGDLDGHEDIAATNGWIVGGYEDDNSRFFHNPADAALPFADASDEVRFNDPFYGSSLIAADFDRDGDQDLLQLCMDGQLRLLDNQPVARPDRNYLVIKPRQDPPNRFAVGAKVRVTVGGQVMTRWIRAGTSYLGQEPFEAFFGLGVATVADSVEVIWPDGGSTVQSEVAANQVLTVERNPAVPAASMWGLVVIALVVLAGGTVLVRRHSSSDAWHG